MISKMENELRMVNGRCVVRMRELPNWYGIEDIGFIWRGQWADPQIEYNKMRVNATVVENTMWERFAL